MTLLDFMIIGNLGVMTDFDEDTMLPRPDAAKLNELFVGKTLHEVKVPAAVVDRLIVLKNCDRMLRACENSQTSR